MESEDLKNRSKQVALRVIRLIKAMEQDLASQTIASQIIRSATSISANYRSVCLAKSRKDFINKLRTCAEEADETAHWLELLIESNLFPPEKLLPLKTESEELTKIFLASIKTARDNS